MLNEETVAETLVSLEKATGEVLREIPLVPAAEVPNRCAKAKEAQQAWGALSYAERCAHLEAFKRELQQNAASYAELIVRETGGIPGKAEYEVGGAIDELTAAIGLAARPVGEVLRSGAPGRVSTSVRRPVGVVAVLTPWNFPLILAMRAVAPALALGNTVVLKPSPETPLSGGAELERMANAAGLPEGVLQVLVTDIAGSRALVADPSVDLVHFTGSTAVGSEIAATTGSLLKRTSLELGGNNSVLVLDDADVSHAAGIGAWSSFHYQGQTCISASRHLVHSSLVDDYAAAVAAKAEAIQVGDPMDPAFNLGPMISERQVERAHRILRESVEKGAKILTGGTSDGLFFTPTVVVGVEPGMPLWDEEVFAPILPITAFDDEEKALGLVNDSSYNLANAIVTSDVSRGQSLAERMRTGMAHVNDSTCIDEATAPFGGIGQSGLGERSGGEANFEAFTERQWITVNRDEVQYPY